MEEVASGWEPEKSNLMIRILNVEYRISMSSSPSKPPGTEEGLDIGFNHLANDLINHVYIMKLIKPEK